MPDDLLKLDGPITVEPATPRPFPATFAEQLEQICTEDITLVLKKQRSYGNAATDPMRIFSRSDSIEQIKVRIDEHGERARERLDIVGHVPESLPHQRSGPAPTDGRPRVGSLPGGEGQPMSAKADWLAGSAEEQVAILAACLRSIRDQAQATLYRRQHPGGQQCGTDRWAPVPPSVAIALERDIRHSLEMAGVPLEEEP
jgi:hypothetical protein